MGLIVDKQIDRLRIIDDDESARSSLVEILYDSEFKTVSQDEKVNDVDAFIANELQGSDAVISDHQLKKKNYFPVNGAEIVAKCYAKHIPGILVTRYDKTQMAEIRRFRKNIPVILNPSDFEPDTVHFSLETCVREFKGDIRADRKLRRTLVRIDSIDDGHIYIVIPGWDTSEIISVGKNELPEDILKIIDVDKRMHVKVNIGCENPNDLYFDNWETK